MNYFSGMVDRRKTFSLISAGTIVGDPHYRESPTRRKILLLYILLALFLIHCVFNSFWLSELCDLKSESECSLHAEFLEERAEPDIKIV